MSVEKVEEPIEIFDFDRYQDLATESAMVAKGGYEKLVGVKSWGVPTWEMEKRNGEDGSIQTIFFYSEFREMREIMPHEVRFFEFGSDKRLSRAMYGTIPNGTELIPTIESCRQVVDFTPDAQVRLANLSSTDYHFPNFMNGCVVNANGELVEHVWLGDKKVRMKFARRGMSDQWEFHTATVNKDVIPATDMHRLFPQVAELDMNKLVEATLKEPNENLIVKRTPLDEFAGQKSVIVTSATGLIVGPEQIINEEKPELDYSFFGQAFNSFRRPNDWLIFCDSIFGKSEAVSLVPASFEVDGESLAMVSDSVLRLNVNGSIGDMDLPRAIQVYPIGKIASHEIACSEYARGDYTNYILNALIELYLEQLT